MTLTGILTAAIITIVPTGGQLSNSEDICGGEVGGTYYNWEISVCEGEDMKFEGKHEEGHLIEDKYLNQDQRDQYKALYEKHHKIGVRSFQREYGYNDWQESFADDYASWKLGERVNILTKKRIKLIISFLK